LIGIKIALEQPALVLLGESCAFVGDTDSDAFALARRGDKRVLSCRRAICY
jgi:hypothetical protein